MAPFYDRLRASAERLIKRFGSAATLTRTTRATFDAGAGSYGTETEAEYPTLAVLRDYEDRLIDGTRIVRGDRRAILDPGVVPVIGDTLTIGGTDYRVIAVKTENPGGTPVYYEAQVRLA